MIKHYIGDNIFRIKLSIQCFVLIDASRIVNINVRGRIEKHIATCVKISSFCANVSYLIKGLQLFIIKLLFPPYQAIPASGNSYFQAWVNNPSYLKKAYLNVLNQK